MRDWLDAIPNLGVPGVPGVPPQKTAGYTGTPQEEARVPGVPDGAQRAPRSTPYATLRRWEANLTTLDPERGPAVVESRRWLKLLEDAAWLFRRHGLQLAQEGWSDLDAFGVSLRRPNGEVLLDRLDGSRSLMLDGKGRAAWGWSYTSVTCQVARGFAELQPAGDIVLLWEIGR